MKPPLFLRFDSLEINVNTKNRSACEHPFVTSQGSACMRFRRALDSLASESTERYDPAVDPATR
jgi:hypothetical protein